MTSLPFYYDVINPLRWRHYPSTMTSLTSLRWRHYPSTMTSLTLYDDVTKPSTMTSLTLYDDVTNSSHGTITSCRGFWVVGRGNISLRGATIKHTIEKREIMPRYEGIKFGEIGYQYRILVPGNEGISGYQCRGTRIQGRGTRARGKKLNTKKR